MKASAGGNGIPPLPEGFLKCLAPLLKAEAQDFLHAYDLPYCRGLRRNPAKVPEGGLDKWVDGLQETIPWEGEGRYIAADSSAGANLLQEAGAYYLQEPSAMAAVAALDPKPGERVLDLCAAPGGKSGQIASRLRGRGLLVSNEPVPSRAAILSATIERLGVANGAVTCEQPARLTEKWPDFFDRVLVDAPCSGEGMFRRHLEARLEWTVQTPLHCARRQSEILQSAAGLVKAGGVLCYSTCTFNCLENEGVVEAFLRSHPEFHLKPFTISPGLAAEGGMLRLWPHRMAGEGHFVALMKKAPGEATAYTGRMTGLPLPDRENLAAYGAFMREAGSTGLEPNGLFAGRLVAAPDLPDLSGIRVLRAGLHLGEARGKRFLPDHAWAMAGEGLFDGPSVSLDLGEAEAFLRGEALPRGDGGGWAVMRYLGLALGWGKTADGRIQNHYPKGLRKG